MDDATRFSFELPANGCVVRNNVTTSAKMFGCQVATNAGFFSFKGACEGDTVINGRTITWDTKDRASFGVLRNGSTLLGYVANDTDYPLESLVSGNGWLIRNG